jgi:hypothetical protein
VLNVEQKNLSEKLSSIEEKNDDSLLPVSKFIKFYLTVIHDVDSLRNPFLCYTIIKLTIILRIFIVI